MRGASQRRVTQPSPPRRLTPCSWIGTPVNRQRIRGRRASRTGARPRIYRLYACVFLIIQAKYRGFTGDTLRHGRACPGHPRLNQSATVGWAKRSVPTVWHTALSPRWPPTFALDVGTARSAPLPTLRKLKCKVPARSTGGHNSDCGFSPTPCRRVRQKNRCQES